MEQAGCGHRGDVARVDPRQRLVERPDRGQLPGAQPVQVHEQVGHEVAAAQVQQRGAGLLARGVEALFDAGQAVDEARAVAQLGADAALEHHARDPVRPHRRGEAFAGAFGVGVRVGQRPVVRVHPEDRVDPACRLGHVVGVALVADGQIDEVGQVGVEVTGVALAEGTGAGATVTGSSRRGRTPAWHSIRTTCDPTCPVGVVTAIGTGSWGVPAIIRV